MLLTRAFAEMLKDYVAFNGLIERCYILCLGRG